MEPYGGKEKMQKKNIFCTNGKRVLVLLLMVCIIAGMMPIAASAATARPIGLDKLIDAINAEGESHTITLASNITNVSEPIVIPSGKNITLNLSGYTIADPAYLRQSMNSKMKGKPIIQVSTGATLTIQNYKNSGDINNGSEEGICISNLGTLNIEGGSYEVKGKNAVGVNNSGTFTFTKGTILASGISSTGVINNGVYTPGGIIKTKGSKAVALLDNTQGTNGQGTVIGGGAGGNRVLATPSKPTVYVDGKAVTFDAYYINQNNYFKLRDLAYVLSGSLKQFNVDWDSVNSAILLTSRTPYTIVGGEMSSKGTQSTNALLSSHNVYLDNRKVDLTAYTINSNNYFKLRDIAKALDFDVVWDSVKNQIMIYTARPYTS